MLVLAVLLVITPTATERSWWAAAALGFLVAAHGVFGCSPIPRTMPG